MANIFPKVAPYDTNGVIMSTLEKQVMVLIKSRARGIGLTQLKVARSLKVSLATVKRWWAGRGINLSVLSNLCALTGVSLSQLFLEVEAGAGSYSYSLEQERLLAQNPRILALFDLLIGGDSVKSLQRKFSIPEAELTSMLLKLDRADLIELHEGNRVKIKQPGEPQWIAGGPLSQKYRPQMIEAFLGDHPKNEISFYIHDYLPEDIVLLRGKLKELESLLLTCNVRAGMQHERAESFGVYLCLKKFEWNLREILKRN